MKQTAIRRPPTKREKDLEKEPQCVFDPLHNASCTKYREPNKKDCDSCIMASIIEDLKYEHSSEVMRWFIAYARMRNKYEAH